MRPREEILQASFDQSEWGPEANKYKVFRAILEVLLDIRQQMDIMDFLQKVSITQEIEKHEKQR